MNRGTLISIFLMASAIIQAIMKSAGASHTMLLLLYGFFMAFILGFMGDQGFGRDEGYSFKDIGNKVPNDVKKGGKLKGLATQIKYIVGTLSTSEFWRYIVTVFLDMFISMPIQSVITSVFDGTFKSLALAVPLLPMGLSQTLNVLVKNIDNILQSFVGFITFLSYANDTRFRWAYPSKDINPNKLISTTLIKLATCVAGVVYLVANVSADFNVVEGVKVKVGTSLSDRLDRKMYFVIIMTILLTIGSSSEKSFMNYQPNKYYIAPIQNYKGNEFWKVK